MSSRDHGGGGGTSKPADVLSWLQALFEESPVAIGFSRDGVVLDVNPAYARLFGYGSRAELRGRSLLEQIAPSHRARILETEFPFDITTTRVVVADGPLTIAFIVDASERDSALEALRASEERFRTLSGAAFEGVIIHGGGTITLANEAGAAMYGFEDAASMVGVSIMDLTAPESRALVADHVRREAVDSYEGVACRRDGSRFIVDVRGRTLSHQGRPTRVTAVRDITERRRAEAEQRALAERVRQTQKLESLGVLAGGVAHDFNNILTVIANEVTLAQREASTGPASTAHLDAIALAAERAADLCRQMLAYAGKARFARETVDLSALVAEMSSMLQVSIAKKVTLVREVAPGLPTIVGDATQIRQIVMNLVLNASEAISGPHGTIRASTGTGTYDAGAFVRSPAGGEPKSGPYVWLEVRDDGAGMDGPTVAQMFEPFFTTKFVGRGLGMAAVLGIVRGHGGAIDVESKPGEGTRIRVFFPVPAVEPVREAPGAAEVLRGQGVVLVVDDEKNVRRSTQLLLEGFGFEVLVARDGVEALEVCRAEPGRIGAVLLDLTMPRMDGVETLRELRRIAPELPVVLASGYGDGGLEDARLEPRRGEGPDAVLAKPYPAERLVATLRRVMGTRSPG